MSIYKYYFIYAYLNNIPVKIDIHPRINFQRAENLYED